MSRQKQICDIGCLIWRKLKALKIQLFKIMVHMVRDGEIANQINAWSYGIKLKRLKKVWSTEFLLPHKIAKKEFKGCL